MPKPYDGPNPTIWSSDPMLGNVPEQNYHGRVVFEAWDKNVNMFHASDHDETSTGLLDKTLSSLRNIKEDKVLKKTPWTDDPEMGETEKETFRGRVVVEIWDNEAKIAITGKDQISNLAKRVANRLDKHLKNQN